MCKTIAGGVFATLGLFSLPALAQQSSPFSLTFDMELPPASVADCAGPLSLAFNPAELAWGDDFEIYFFHQQKLKDEAGQSAWSSSGADGLLLRAGRLGLGLQWIRPLEEDERYNYLKTTVALPLLSLGKWFALGSALEILDPTNSSADASFDYILGALIHPWQYVSLGVAGRNLGRASVQGWRSERALDLAIAVRPLWFAAERARLSADLRLVENADDPPLKFSGWFVPFRGVSLFGSVDLDGNFGVGVAVDFMQGGTGGYVSMESDAKPSSLVLAARVSSSLRPGLLLSSQRTALVKLDHTVAANPLAAAGFARKTTLWQIEQSIRRTAQDRRVDSLLLRVEDPQIDWSQVEELREALAEVRRAGKKVVVHLRDADNTLYYLASAADRILLDPGGMFFVHGPSVEALFVGGALQMIGIRPEYERVGDYKTAVDMLTRDEPSEAHREVLESLADEADDVFVKAIAAGRQMEVEKVRPLLDRGLLTGEEAQAAGLIDGLAIFEDGEKLAEILGHRASTIENYLSEQEAEQSWENRPKIAVICAFGSIDYRESLMNEMDAHRLAETIERVAEDSSIEAVVLRVDSPGGSGAASDLIWQQLKRLREKKPLVVSMGKVAASGGYYISAPADVIVADPSTITGSIGVFALLFDMSELYADLGISKEIIKRSRLADLFTTFRSHTDEEMEVLRKNVQAFYRSFISKVAEGRKKTAEEIDKVGRGRVWTGRQARERGLVDELGGLHKAVELAKARAGIAADSKIDLVFLPKPGFSLGQLASFFGLQEEKRDFIELLEQLDLKARQLLRLVSFGSGKTLALLPFALSIR